MDEVRSEVLAAAHVGGDADLTDEEARLVAVLTDMGLRPVRAAAPGERTGVLWAPNWHWTLRVAFSPTTVLGHPAEDLTQRTIAGMTVHTVQDWDRYLAERDLFVCDGLLYDVSVESGSQVNPFGWDSNEAFLAELIAGIGCGSASS